MVKKARIKIILTLAMVFGIAIAIVIALIFIFEKKQNRNDISELITNHFRVLVEYDNNTDRIPEVGNVEKPQENAVKNDYYSIDRQRECIYTIRTINCTGTETEEKFEIYERATSGNLTDEEIMAVGEDIFSLDSLSGTWKEYVYGSTLVNGYLVVSFVDITSIITDEMHFFINLVVIGACVWGVLITASIPVSAVLVKPLEEAIRRQFEFVRMAEHELKTPLSVMQTSLSMLEEEGVNSKYLNYAKIENDKMKKLVAELLDLSRSEQLERKNLVYKVINLSECVEGAVLPFESLAYEKEVTIDICIDDNIFMPAEFAQIDRLVGILIDNAIKHTAKGENIIVKLFKHKNSEKIELSVGNQGTAIPTDERQKIFEPFYRIDKSRNRDEGRYGLGLSIAQSICSAHNGTISVDFSDGYNIFKVIFS